MRGRQAEWGLVTGLLRGAGTARGGVILVEGERGTGKSTMLAEAAVAAGTEGYCVLAGAAERLERLIPLSPLRLALTKSAGSQPAGSQSAELAADEAPAGDDLESGMRLINAVGERLATMTTAAPVLVTLDDLDQADPVTLLALRMLPSRLAGRPLVWLLARAAAPGGDAARLFDLLEAEGGIRIGLQPLTDTAVAELVTDLLGAAPDDELVSLAGAADGNPFVVTAILRGLAEENAIRVDDGHARLVSVVVPDRYRVLIGRQIGAVTPATRQLLETCAVLGLSFAIEDAAEMLAQPPAVLLPAINEALAARLLVCGGESLSFRHPLVWRAVADAMPEPVRHALHRQFGEILLGRGNSAPLAARHLLQGTPRADAQGLAQLEQAARQVLRSAPGIAADLMVRALELTDRDDPSRAERSLATARALTAARRVGEAMSLVDSALGESPRPVPRARLRCVLAFLLNIAGRPDQGRAEAEAVLAEPYLPDSVRDEAAIATLAALAEFLDTTEAEKKVAAILGAPHTSGKVAVAASAALAAVRWNDGLVTESLRLSYGAISGTATAEPSDSWTFRAGLDLASRLVDIRRFDAATALIGTPLPEPDPAVIADAQAYPALLRARMDLAAGRPDRAAAEARTIAGDDQQLKLCRYAMLARMLLGMVALRGGDLVAAGRILDQISTLAPDDHSGYTGIQLRAFAAQVCAVQDGVRAALELAAPIYDNIGEYRWLLLADPATAPWLARLALAADDRDRAASIGAATGYLGEVNSEIPVVTAACAHVRGLLDRDADLLRTAVRTETDGWANASAAEDLGVLLASAGRAEDAIASLKQAQDGYERVKAVMDAARARRRLRRLGVIRRRRDQKRPAKGWASLTETERGVAELTALGMTNRRMAEQMFVSANTVAFHLRQIFRKLGVESRVELARFVMEHSGEAHANGPGPRVPGEPPPALIPASRPRP